MSEVQIRRNLTKGNKETITRLNKQDYSEITQAQITRLLGRMLDSKQTADEILQVISVLSPLRINPKHPPPLSVSPSQLLLEKKRTRI